MASISVLDQYSSLRRELGLMLGQELGRFSFGHKQMLILFHLSRMEVCTMGELAAQTMSDKATITRAVSALEKSGLTKRLPDPNDSRISNIQLTAKGRTEAAKAEAVRTTLREAIDSTLNKNERELLSGLLGRVVAGLQARRK